MFSQPPSLPLSHAPGVNGVPAEDNFRHESCEYPADPPPGHVLVQNLYLSVDPAQVCGELETFSWIAGPVLALLRDGRFLVNSPVNL